MSGEPEPLHGGVLVVGTGLMGTSVGLALRARGTRVWLSDQDPAAASLASAMGAGEVGEPDADPALVVVCVPPSDVGAVVDRLGRRYLSATLSDVTSVKNHVLVEVESSPAGDRFVGGHPMAGRERVGAAVARADLFAGRPWILTPGPGTDERSLRRAVALVEACAAELVLVEPTRHDEAVALVSHAPQVMASLMAARLADADDDLVALAGPGVRDVTRVAASDPELWSQILIANAAQVLPVLDGCQQDLSAIRAALATVAAADASLTGPSDRTELADATQAVTDLLTRGVRGRGRLPGKHGVRRTDYAAVTVVVPDEPGQLAGLFSAADRAEVNVEDVSIEHAQGHPVGVVELLVAPDVADRLASALAADGWDVHR